MTALQNPVPEIFSGSIWERVKPIPFPDLPGNIAPYFFGGDHVGCFRKMVCIGAKQFWPHGNDSALPVTDKRQSDEASAAIINEAADVDIAFVLRGDPDFLHADFLRASRADRTIAKGGEAANAGLNNRRRTPGGRS